MNKVYIFDIETDNIDAKVIRCLSYCDSKIGEITTLTDYEKMKLFFQEEGVYYCGHNICVFDIPVIKRILNIEINKPLIDTLALSWLLYPERIKHGLGSYSEDYGIEKPKIEDYANQDIEEIKRRCAQDVKINVKLWKDMEWYLNELYDADQQAIDKYIDYVSDKMQYISDQQFLGLKLDNELCVSSLTTLEGLKETKIDTLKVGMPKVELISTKFPPKKMKKENGELSAIGVKWMNFLKERNLPEDYNQEVDFVNGYEEPNPNSHDQIKKWLFGLGWVPENIKHFRDKKKNEVRKIPQIKSKDEEGEICSSIKKLFLIAPALEALDDLFVISHRISIFKGFLRDVKNGLLYQGCSGLTNTMRIQQSVLVNLPSVSKPYAENIRKSLITRSNNHILVNADLSGVEDATKRHFIYKYDPEYVEEMNTPDYDPHLTMAVLAGFLTKEEVDFFKKYENDKKKAEALNIKFNSPEEDKIEHKRIKEVRQKAKTANFALTYKCGIATLARQTGLKEKDAKKLADAYWSKNRAILDVENSLRYKEIGQKMWILNPISGFWLSLRNSKDKFSTLNQNLATYVFDLWIKNMRTLGLKIPYYYHDEILTEVYKIDLKETEEIINKAMTMVNEELKLNVTVGCSINSGLNYAETH